MDHAMQAFLPSATALALYGAYAALAATTAAGVFLIALVVRRRRRHRKPIPIPDYRIRHTWWGRLKSLIWRVLAAIAGFLIMRWLLLDGHADHVIQRAKDAIAVVVNVLTRLIETLPVVS